VNLYVLNSYPEHCWLGENLDSRPALVRSSSSQNSSLRTSSTDTHPASSFPNSDQSEGRGRKRRSARFSLSSVSSAILETIRSSSPRNKTFNDANQKGPVGDRPDNSSVRHVKEKSQIVKLTDFLKNEEKGKVEGDGWKEFKKGE
jgi:hypothetical protein